MEPSTPGPTDPAAPAASPATAPSPTTPAEPPARKRRGWRVLKWTILVLLLVVVGVGVIVYLNLNAIVERTFERQATASTNLQTDLGAARLSLFGGSLELDDLEVASPQGFEAPHMLTLSDAHVNVSLGELRSDPVRIQSITLDKPKLVIEQGPDGLNFKVASDLMPKEDPPADPQKEPLKLVIGDLTIQDASVVVRPGIAGLAEEIIVPIPSVTMKNIGTGEGAENGAAIKDVLMQVVTVLAARASTSGNLPEQLQQILNADLKQVTAQLGAEAQRRIAQAVPGELGEVLGSIVADPDALIEDPGRVIQDTVEGKIGDLLGGDKRSKDDADSTGEKPDKSLEQGLKDLIPGSREKQKKDRQR